MISLRPLVAWTIIIFLQIFVQGSVLRLPSGNTSSLPFLRNSTSPLLNVWPPAPFDVYLWDALPFISIHFEWLHESPRRPNQHPIQTSLIGLQMAIMYNDRRFPDPIDLNKYPFGVLIVTLQLLDVREKPMWRQYAQKMISRVEELFEERGPVWFDSQLRIREEVVGRFDLRC